MRFKITYAVFQEGQHDEDVEATYTFDSPEDALNAVADFANVQAMGALNRWPQKSGQPTAVAQGQRNRFQAASRSYLRPPPVRKGLGAGTTLVIKNLELL